MNSKPDVNSMVESYLSEIPGLEKGQIYIVYDQYRNEQGRSVDKNVLKNILIGLLNDPTRELNLNVEVEDEFKVNGLSKEEFDATVNRYTKFLSEIKCRNKNFHCILRDCETCADKDETETLKYLKSGICAGCGNLTVIDDQHFCNSCKDLIEVRRSTNKSLIEASKYSVPNDEWKRLVDTARKLGKELSENEYISFINLLFEIKDKRRRKDETES